jgi:hypothetical protein
MYITKHNFLAHAFKKIVPTFFIKIKWNKMG